MYFGAGFPVRHVCQIKRQGQRKRNREWRRKIKGWKHNQKGTERKGNRTRKIEGHVTKGRRDALNTPSFQCLAEIVFTKTEYQNRVEKISLRWKIVGENIITIIVLFFHFLLL